MKIRFSISRKLFLGFFLVTVLPMTVGALYFYDRLESHLHEDVLKSSLMRTQQVGEEIQRHIREIDELIDYTASQYVFNRDNDKLLVWTYHLKPAISRLVVVGSDNRVIEALCRYGYLGRGAMSPLLAFTPDMPHQKMLFFSQWQLEPQMVIVRPIIPLTTGIQQGYLMAEISMKNFFNRFNRETPGKSRTFLVNLAGKVVAHRNLNLVLKGARADGFVPVAKTLHGSGSAQGEYKDYTGQQVFGVAARIPGIPLIVVNEIPLKDAFLFVHQMRSQFLLVLLGSMLLIFFGTWIIARSITRPISLLYRAAEKIRKGDLVAVEGDFPDDEIGFFAQCFNQMILTLKVDRDFREQAEAELRESEKRYRLVADYAYDMECWRDEDGSFLHVSPSCEIITGYSRNEFYDNKFLMDEIVVAEDKHVFIDHRHEVNQDGTFKPIEFRIRHKDGSIRWLSHICRPVLGTDGENLGVRGSNRDVTIRKQAEISLAIEKERLLTTLRSIGDGVITTDNSGLVTMLNQVAENLTGWSGRNALGRSIEEVFPIIHERTRKPLPNPVSQALQENRIVELANYALLLTCDQNEIAIADSAAPIVGADGNRYGVVLVFRDVRDEKQLQHERLRAGKLEAVGVLAGGIAHDFNNLLMGLQGSLDLVRFASHKGPEEVEKHIEKAETAVIRAVSLARQFLTFAKGGDPVKGRTALPALVQESAEFVLHGSQVKLECDFSQSIWDVEADSGQISQVINNLVTNARQAMNDVGLIRIEIFNVELVEDEAHKLSLPPGAYVRVVVADQGPGIEPELIEKIFQPYFTTKPEGSGLGLATSYSIITNHGGYLGVDSNLGDGCKFYFLLPATDQCPSQPVIEPESIKSEERTKLDGLRVLVMDDEEIICEVVFEMLEMLGCKVVCVKDGLELLEVYQSAQARGERFDVVLMDLTIPGGMGGREAIRKLRKLDPAAKVIVSSGYSQDPVMADFRKYGFDGMVPKPYRIEALVEVIDSLCQKG